MITLGVTYETVTPESAEQGDVADTGWHLERETWKPGLLREFLTPLLRHHVEPSESPGISQRTCWTAYNTNEGTREYYETGAEQSLSFHISGATLSTMRRIHRILTN